MKSFDTLKKHNTYSYNYKFLINKRLEINFNKIFIYFKFTLYIIFNQK